MRLPILSYGFPILRRQCQPVDTGSPELPALIDNMWETMRGADGCGLAASQVDQPLALFIVDSKSTYDQLSPEERAEYFDPQDHGITETFINAVITRRSDETWDDDEGCLSIPGLACPVTRPWEIDIEYTDRTLVRRQRTFRGLTARMVQHEYDHTQGILYLDYLSPLTRARIASKLRKISRGEIRAKYPMRYVK